MDLLDVADGTYHAGRERLATLLLRFAAAHGLLLMNMGGDIRF
jgi:hypothetical protein